ncbi:MAG: LCP family protein [Patescibacteria group bacterium]|nr:LCP family protein [Patescibacteria group bacterium]MCL5094204.1 LCP family protein [Patescibacteria group bacterium]
MGSEIRISEKDSFGGLGRNGNGQKTPLKFSKKNKVRKWSRKKTILSILAVIFVLLGVFGYKIFGSLSKMFDKGFSIGSLLGDVEQLKGESAGRVNILLLGVGDKGHEGETLSDTVMVVSLDTKKKNVAMISIPRDMWVNIPGYGYAKINEAHADGEQKKPGSGPEKAKETVSQVLDIPIHYYARVDFSGFSKIIDSIGGIDINVEEDIYDPYYPDEGDGETIYQIEKGMHHMNGEEALKYARSRKTTSDFDRAKRQQQVLVAIKEKFLSTENVFNPQKILEVSNILGDHIKTDFQLGEVKRLYNLSKGISRENVINKVIDEKDTKLLVGAMSDGGASILKPTSGNYKEIREFVQNIFYESYIKEENAKISVLNGTSIQGLADRFSRSLEKSNYNVINTSSTEEYESRTVIYDLSNGSKSYTLDFLKKKLDAPVLTKSGDGSADIEIVLGNDYYEDTY